MGAVPDPVFLDNSHQDSQTQLLQRNWDPNAPRRAPAQRDSGPIQASRLQTGTEKRERSRRPHEARILETPPSTGCAETPAVPGGPRTPRLHHLTPARFPEDAASAPLTPDRSPSLSPGSLQRSPSKPPRSALPRPLLGLESAALRPARPGAAKTARPEGARLPRGSGWETPLLRLPRDPQPGLGTVGDSPPAPARCPAREFAPRPPGSPPATPRSQPAPPRSQPAPPDTPPRWLGQSEPGKREGRGLGAAPGGRPGS